MVKTSLDTKNTKRITYRTYLYLYTTNLKLFYFPSKSSKNYYVFISFGVVLVEKARAGGAGGVGVTFYRLLRVRTNLKMIISILNLIFKCV